MRNAYLIIATSWTLICPNAIAQGDNGKTAATSNKSVAAGTTSSIPVAPAMVLPKTNISPPLKKAVQRKARGAYPSSHYQKAMYYKQKNDKSRALVEFLKATQENPRLVKAYYEQALIFRERNYLKLAQSSLDQALAIKPEYQEARMLLATIQIQQGNVGAAMKQLGQSLGINVGTGDGAKTDDEVPQPMVLQSVHMALPEGMARNVMKVVKANPSDEVNAAQESSRENEPLKRSSKKSKSKKTDGAASSGLAATGSGVSGSGTGSPVESNNGGMQIIEPVKDSSQSSDNEIAIGGIRIPNPLHMFWSSKPEPTPEQPATKITVAKKSNLSNSDFVYVRKGADSADSAADDSPVGRPPISGDFSDEAAANLDVSKLPALPSDEPKTESAESKVPAKESRAERRARLAREAAENAQREAAEKETAEKARKEATKASEESKEKTLNEFDSANADSQKSDVTARGSDKQSKKSKKSWLSRFIPSFEEDLNETPAPPPTSPLDRAVATAISAGGSAVKQGMATELPGVPGVPVETFDKPDESRAIVEKVTSAAQAAATNLSNIAKTGFQLPPMPTINSSLFGGFGTGGGANTNDLNQSLTNEAPKPYKPQIAPNSDDPWSVRLRYLADHGTGTLKEGEAFMFSEESGEATLFLADGQTVRRTIYLPRDAQEVVKQRRPDIVNPDDLLYNLSLLAKLMPRASQQQQQPSSNPPIQTIIGAPAQQPQQAPSQTPNFDAKDMMGKSQKFWGWLKGRFENLVPN